MAKAKDEERPNRSMEIVVLERPIKMIGLRPKRSESKPQGIAKKKIRMMLALLSSLSL
jgi:hypothetical protein